MGEAETAVTVIGTAGKSISFRDTGEGYGTKFFRTVSITQACAKIQINSCVLIAFAAACYPCLVCHGIDSDGDGI